MKYDSITYSDEELFYFNRIKNSEVELKKFEKLSKEEQENLNDPYVAKKIDLKNEIVSSVMALTRFGIDIAGLRNYEDVQECYDYLTWYKRIDEQEQIKIYNQLLSLKNKIDTAEQNNSEVSGKSALVSSLKRKFLAEVKKLERHDVDMSKLTSPKEAIDAFNTSWEISQPSDSLQAWHFSIIGIKGAWELSKYFHKNSMRKVKK